MRIDHGPVQAMQVHHPPTPGDLPGSANSVHAKENFRILQAEAEDSSAKNLEMGPLRLGSKVDGFERKGQQWFVATELQSDLVVEVGDMSFHLHKFPLLSRSGKLNRLVFDSRDVENSHIKLDDMPGGPETFELAAKFCYGVAVELTAANVAALRCAAEYLEMTEDLEEGNLVSKTEAFLSFVVLASWKDSIAVLQSCEKLLPWAEQLQIVRRCCESIAWKACTDPRGIRWSFTERAEATKKSHASPIWTGPKGSCPNSISDQVPSDWWFEDICVVCVSFFTKIIAAIKVKGMRYDLIGSAVVHYAIKWLPGLTRDFVVMSKDPKEPTLVDGSFLQFGVGNHGTKEKEDEAAAKSSDLGSVQEKNRVLVETLVGMLPPQKDAVPCTFLLRMLRLSKMLSINPGLITELEKRAGQLLDQGTLSDLLIPSFDHTCETLFDVDLVQRLLDYFLLQDFASPVGTQSPAHSDKDKSGIATPGSDKMHPHSSYAAKMRVAKLIDNYLAEVGRDQNLTLHKFLSLAEALPEHTRVTDDGLYKALDTYLKAHPLLTEHERKKLCRTLDCQRLSLDACMHAAQNERLPLRVVVQVLFGEQIKLRNAVTGSSSVSKDVGPPHPPHEDGSHSPDSSHHESFSRGLSHERGSGHHSDHHDSLHLNPEESEEEIRVLRSDMEKMKGKFMALQHDYSAIQHQLEKLTKHPKPPSHNNHHHHHSGWKKLIPHPHFHVPHVLTHPLDIFHHHKDHHHHHGKDHHGKDHHGKDHHGHGKDSHHGHGHDKDHHGHGHGKDSHHGHGKDSHHGHGHHGKDGHHDHGHGHHGKDSHHDHGHGHHGKDIHHDHGHHGKDSHHDHGHGHHGDSHHDHGHHGKDNHHDHGHHGKDNHHDHGHHGKESHRDHGHGHHGKESPHNHGFGHHGKESHHDHGESYGHSGKDSHHHHDHGHGKDTHHHGHGHHGKDIHHDHGHGHGKDIHHDHGRGPGKESHRHHHHDLGHTKDIHHDHVHHHGKAGGLDSSNHGSKKHDAQDHLQTIDSFHQSGSSDHSKHSHHDHDSSTFHHHHHSKETPRHSKDHDLLLLKEHEHPLYVKEAFHSPMGPEAFKESIIQARGHHSAIKGPEAFKETMAVAHAHIHHSKNHHHSKDSPHSKDEDHRHHHTQASPEHKEYPLNAHDHPAVVISHHKVSHEEHRCSKDSTHSSHHSEHHKDGEPRLSSSHLSSGEDSSRSMEGPTTPTHPVEHKKHRPFANAIRKWRNSIS